MRRTWIAAIGLLALCAPARAETPAPSSPLDEEHGWPAGTIAEQLDRDATVLPFGKGGIFVPALTNPLDEPPISVWQEGQKVAEGTTGRRIPLLPGHYIVGMGSGAVEQRFDVGVEVRELNTSVLPVTWAGLVVHVFDEHFNSIRSSYEIIAVDDREYVGVGFGADEEAGEPVTTWVLRPGLYKIVRTGETYRARRDFATVRLLPGHLTHFLLVVDEDTGEFQGGGEVPQEDLFVVQREGLWYTLVLGGDFALYDRRNTPGSLDGRSYAFRAFLDTKLSAELFGSPLIWRLQIEEGQTKAADTHWQKTQDRADLDALYVYRLYPWLGPYLRGGADTNLIEGRVHFDEPTDVVIMDPDGNELRRREGRTSLRLSPPLGLTSIKEGAGLNVRVLKAVFGEATLRLGVGARHQLTRGLLEERGGAYITVPSTNQVGVEGTLLAMARVTRWVLINIEVDTLVPFDDVNQVVIELDGTLALKLTSYLSVNYVVRYLHDRTFLNEDRLAQDVLLRFSIELL